MRRRNLVKKKKRYVNSKNPNFIVHAKAAHNFTYEISCLDRVLQDNAHFFLIESLNIIFFKFRMDYTVQKRKYITLNQTINASSKHFC